MSERDEAHAAPDGGPDDDRETAYDLLQRGQALLDRRHFAQAAIVLERADRQEPEGPILEALGGVFKLRPDRARPQRRSSSAGDEPSSPTRTTHRPEPETAAGPTRRDTPSRRPSPDNTLYSGAHRAPWAEGELMVPPSRPRPRSRTAALPPEPERATSDWHP